MLRKADAEAARIAELQASRERIVAAGDAERRRLERNLHDGAQQRLVSVALLLRQLQGRVRDDPSATELVTTASEQLALSMAELRELARGIHPAILEHGLAGALQSLASRSPVPTTVSYEVPDRLPAPVELAAYFVACEGLANVAKYAHASRAGVRVWRAGRGGEHRDRRRRNRRSQRDGRARACAGWPIASRRCRAACRSSARLVRGTVVRADIPCESSIAGAQ